MLLLFSKALMINCNSTMTLAGAGLRLGRGDIEDSVDATQYRGKVGSLRYLCNTRLDLVFCVGSSRFMECPKASIDGSQKDF